MKKVGAWNIDENFVAQNQINFFSKQIDFVFEWIFTLRKQI